MEAQAQNEMPAEIQAQADIENELADKRKKDRRKKIETISFVILIIGFATILIPNAHIGKYGEYTMFVGAIIYFSGRFNDNRRNPKGRSGGF